LQDNNEESVTPKEMLAELFSDNQQLTRSLRSTHEVCEKHNDVATASLIENWIDQTERRTWFLAEIVRIFRQSIAASEDRQSSHFLFAGRVSKKLSSPVAIHCRYLRTKVG